MNQPEFDIEFSHDLAGLFWEMIASVGLLDSEIYEIQEVWTEKEDFWYPNDVLKLLPEGLQFFCPIFPSELPMVMGLKGVHHPDALHHFAGLTFCPWCGKEGQNEGTVVNHLWTMHYKLGLVCGRCLHFPLITSEAIQCHGQGCKQPMESDTEEEDGGLTMYSCWNSQFQPSPLAKSLSVMPVAVQAPQNTHTSNHCYFPVFKQLLVVVFTVSITLHKSTFINDFTTFTLS